MSSDLIERLAWVRANLRRTDAENVAYYPVDPSLSLGGIVDGVIELAFDMRHNGRRTYLKLNRADLARITRIQK